MPYNVDQGPGPTRPGGLADPVRGIEGTGVAGPIIVARRVGEELTVTAGLIYGIGPSRGRNDAILSYRPDGRETLHYASRLAIHPQRAATRFFAMTGGTAEDPHMSLELRDLPSGDTLLADVRLTERFPGGVLGACNPYPANILFAGDAESLVLFRASTCEGATDEGSTITRYRLHVWDRDGAEQTPPLGVPVDERVFMEEIFPEVDSVVTDRDGALWYGAERGTLEDGSVPALRVVRRAPDMTLEMVSEPIADPTLEMAPRRGTGFWGAVTADGAYVAHVVAPAEPGGTGRSHFVRVERDGTIAWRHTTFAIAVRDVYALDRMLVEHDGGIVALVSDASLPADLSMLAIARDGSMPLGPNGIPIAESVGFTEAYRDAWIAIDGDGAGGLFVALMGDDGPIRSAVTHLDADGAVLYGPVIAGFFPNESETELYQAIADTVGGVWLVQSGSTTGLIQHLDALGRPTYGEWVANCRGELPVRWVHSIHDYGDADAGPPADAGPDDASPDAPVPDAPSDLDAGLEDAPGDSNAGMDVR